MRPTDESNTEPILEDGQFVNATTDEVLAAIYASQMRVEAAVTEALDGLAPTLAAIQSKGLMGLLTMGK